MNPVSAPPDAAVIELDATPCRSAEAAEWLGRRLVEAGRRHTRLVIDFSRVSFFGASLLGVLLSAGKRLSARPGDVALCCLSPQALEIMRVTRQDTVWPIFATRAEALGGGTAPEPLVVESAV